MERDFIDGVKADSMTAPREYLQGPTGNREDRTGRTRSPHGGPIKVMQTDP